MKDYKKLAKLSDILISFETSLVQSFQDNIERMSVGRSNPFEAAKSNYEAMHTKRMELVDTIYSLFNE